MSNVQKMVGEREKSQPDHQKYGKFFDGLNQALVALTRCGLDVAVIGGGTFAKQFIEAAQWKTNLDSPCLVVTRYDHKHL